MKKILNLNLTSYGHSFFLLSVVSKIQSPYFKCSFLIADLLDNPGFFTSSGTYPATNAVGYPVEQCCESKYRTLNLDMDPGFWPNLNPDLGLRYQF